MLVQRVLTFALSWQTGVYLPAIAVLGEKLCSRANLCPQAPIANSNVCVVADPVEVKFKLAATYSDHTDCTSV